MNICGNIDTPQAKLLNHIEKFDIADTERRQWQASDQIVTCAVINEKSILDTLDYYVRKVLIVSFFPC